MCSKGQQIVPSKLVGHSCHPLFSWPLIPTPWAVIDSHLFPKIEEKQQNQQIHGFNSYHVYKCVLRANKWCLASLWGHPCYPLPSWPLIVTQSANIDRHLFPKMTKKHENPQIYGFNSYHMYKCVLRANKWCLASLWGQAWYPLSSWPHIVTTWANIQSFVTKNG